MILTGALVNFITVVAGTLVGLVAGKFLNERIRAATMSAEALITIGIAVPGLLNSTKPLVPILSLVIGTVIGEALDIDRAVNRLGDKLQERFKGKGKITEGFVTGTLVFAVGAMTIMGSLDSGLKNDTLSSSPNPSSTASAPSFSPPPWAWEWPSPASVSSSSKAVSPCWPLW